MTYKILLTRLVDVTLITTVEFNFSGEIVVVEIPHFMPNTQADIEQNIINTSQSELAKIQARQQIEAILQLLPINEEKPIE